MTSLADFCTRLRTARIEASLRQIDVADALGVTPSAVALWELGRYRPLDGHLREWAAYLEVPVPDGVEGVLPVACGTRGGYQRHLRRDEKTCDRCRAANTAIYHARQGRAS